MRYQRIAEPRFAVETTTDGEQIRIKARRPVFATLFLPLWPAGWTAGGAAAVWGLATHFEPFRVVWLFFWAVAWIAAAGTLAWMLTGSETLRAVGRDLEVAHCALGWRRRWLYQGPQIRKLRVANQPGWPFRLDFQVPFLNIVQSGAIKFDYGPRTIHVAQGLDDAEGQMIIQHLTGRLPSSVA